MWQRANCKRLGMTTYAAFGFSSLVGQLLIKYRMNFIKLHLNLFQVIVIWSMRHAGHYCINWCCLRFVVYGSKCEVHAHLHFVIFPSLGYECHDSHTQ